MGHPGTRAGGIELATPGGFSHLLRRRALVVGVLELLGLAQPLWLQWLLFTVVAIVALRLFRKPLLDRLRKGEGPDRVDTLVGEVALASANLDPGQYGRAELRGSSWQARNVGTAPLTPGQRTRVVAVNGLVLDIQSE